MRSPLTHLLIALVIAGLALAGYWFMYAGISAKSGEVAGLQDQIMKASQNVSRVASARAAIAEIAGDEAKVRGYFVSKNDMPTFIDALQELGLARKATVTILSISDTGSPAQPALLLPISVTGTFDAVMRTVGAIEYVPYDVSITMLSVAQNDKNSWQASLNLVVGSVPAANATSSAPKKP